MFNPRTYGGETLFSLMGHGGTCGEHMEGIGREETVVATAVLLWRHMAVEGALFWCHETEVTAGYLGIGLRVVALWWRLHSGVITAVCPQ